MGAMGYQLPPDLQQLVADRIATGEYQSEDEVLRDALQALADQDEDLAAVQEAIAELKAGDEGVPMDEAFDAIRTKYGLSRDA